MHLFQSLIPALEHFRLLGYWLVFFVAFAESLAFIGLLIPGTVFIVFIGFLASQGYFDPGDVVWFALAGAVLGDVVSFRLGQGGIKFFHEEHRIFKLSYLHKGETFFKRYGNKSVFLGRFLGPLRPVIPFVAGLLQMDVKKFLFWNVLSGIGWASLYVSVGYFFGSAWSFTELWTPRVGVLILSIIAFLVALSLVSRFFITQGKQLQEFFRSLAEGIGTGLRESVFGTSLAKSSPRLYQWIERRLTLKTFFGLWASVCIVLSLYVGMLFVFLTARVIALHGVLPGDLRFHHLLLAFVHPAVLRLFFWITMLGDAPVVIAIVSALCIICWLWKKTDYIIPLYVAVLGSSAMASLIKIIVERPRPAITAYPEMSHAFPSGHATAAMALYGVLMIVAVREITDWRQKIRAISLGIIMIALIGFSRLYLGVHYLSDVLAGYELGLLWVVVALFLLAYDPLLRWFQHEIHSIRAPQTRRKKIVWTLIMGSIPVIIYGLWAMRQLPLLHTPGETEDTVVMAEADFVQNFVSHGLPLTAETLTGTLRSPVSVLFVAKNDDAIKQTMQRLGWTVSDPAGFATVFRAIGAYLQQRSYPAVSVAFWDTHVQDMAFLYRGSDPHVQPIDLRIWETPFQLVDGRHMYVATVTRDIPRNFGLRHGIDPLIDDARSVLVNQAAALPEVVGVQTVQLPLEIIRRNRRQLPFVTDHMLAIIDIH